MNKQIYLIRGISQEDHKLFTSRIMGICESKFSSNDIQKLVVTLTTFPPPTGGVIPFKKGLVAAISVYKEGHDIDEYLSTAEGFAGVYRVTEALPVTYDKTWKNGEPTPGVCLLTLFRKKKGISWEKFINRWHNGHTPLTMKIHPVWHYNRNVVEERMTGNSEGHDGIVEEHFTDRSLLLNPAKFFGNALTMVPNMIHVYFDVRSFLDYKTTEPYLVQEYHIK
jgi:hypothetical protein